MKTEKRFEAFQRVTVKWDLEMPFAPGGTVTNANKKFVTVRFDGEQRGGIKLVQRFTYRKDGRCIAAHWNWVWGIPELALETANT